MKWSELSMTQKADVISMAVKAGMKDLNSIKSFYNESVGSSREYKKGGYLDWKEKASNYKHLDIDNDNTYDYEGWYNENPERAWNLLKDDPNAHFDDRYKTVYHPTFSTQSKYSGVRDARFNPQGLIGGTWGEDGHTFIMSPDGYRGPVSMDERKAYLEDAEDYGVQLREASGSLPIYGNTVWGGVLPNVTIRPRKFEDGGYTKTYIDSRGREVTFPRIFKETDEQYEARYAERAAIRERNAADNKARYERRRAANEAGAARLNRAINTVTNVMEEQAKATPFTGQEIQQAAEEQREDKLNTWRPIVNTADIAANAVGIMSGNPWILGAVAAPDILQTIDHAANEGIKKSDVLSLGFDALGILGASNVLKPLKYSYRQRTTNRYGLPIERDQEIKYGEYLDALSDWGGKLWGVKDGGDDAIDLWDFGKKVNPNTQFYFRPFSLAEGGSIHIDPSKKGTFTAAASRHGKSVQEFASQVLSHPENYSLTMRKKANFARNASKWKHGLGGNLYGSGGNRIVTTGGAGYVPPVSEDSLNKFKEKVAEASKKAMFYVWDTRAEGFKNPFTYDWSSSAMDNYESGKAQDTFLLPRKLQEEQFLKAGYIKGEKGDYGLVKKAVGKHNYPVYQTAPDAISRDKLIVLGNTYTSFLDHDIDLKHEGSAPSAIYTDGHGNFYQKRWDLNDYGGSEGSTASIAGRLLDAIGSPTVVTTGYQPFGFTDNHPYYVHDLKPMMAKKGLVPIEIDGKTEWTLPEVTVVGKRKKQR